MNNEAYHIQSLLVSRWTLRNATRSQSSELSVHDHLSLILDELSAPCTSSRSLMISRQISVRLLRTFLLSWIVYDGICSATKTVETTLDALIPTSMPTSSTTPRSTSAPIIRSSPTPTIQSADYTVMQVRSLLNFR